MPVQPPLLTPYLLYGLIVGFLAFGILLFFNPWVTLVFAAPWLAEIFLFDNAGFYFVWFQYYSYLIGGMIVAAILAALLVKSNRGALAGVLGMRKGAAGKRRANALIVSSAFSVTAVMLILYPAFVQNGSLYNLQESFLFYTSAQQQAYIGQINSLLPLIPQNASLMADFFITPHVFSRKCLEFAPVYGPLFTPQYIIMDYNSNISIGADTVPVLETIANYTKEYNFSVLARNGSAVLYVRNWPVQDCLS